MRRSDRHRFSPLAGLILILCIAGEAGKAQQSKQEEPEPPAPNPVAIVQTSLGTFEIELYQNDAPKAVENFVKLAEKKFFDKTRVHRVSRSGGVIQMGDDKTRDTTRIKEWGSGGKSYWGRDFADELNPSAPSYREGYKKGVVVMAGRRPNGNTSQFMILLRDLPIMPKKHTIFGKVVRGMDVVEKIGKVEIVPVMGPADGRPRTDVVVYSIAVRSESPRK